MNNLKPTKKVTVNISKFTNLLNSKYVISIMAYTTLFVSSFWGLYMMAPGSVKALYSLSVWVCIAFFPYMLIRWNNFTKWTNYLLWTLLAMTVILILRSVFNSDKTLYAIGNKWLTLFGNEYCALLLLPPLFTYLGTIKYSVHLLKKVTFYYLLMALGLSVFLKFPMAMLSTFIIVFYPYANKKYRILIILAFAEAIIKSFWGENPTRMFLIIVPFALCSYFLVYINKNKKILRIFALLVIIAPWLLFVPALMLSKGEKSWFQQAQQYIMQESGDKDLANDTRTFLYIEMANDLTKNNSWLFGKGAFSRYYSLYFDQSSLGRVGRISSEVPFLTHLLKGGILYVIAYYGLLIYAIYLGIWKGRNKFVHSIAVIALGWYFNSFVGDITGCRFYHLAFFTLLGCCLSKSWLNYSDNKIRYILK